MPQLPAVRGLSKRVLDKTSALKGALWFFFLLTLWLPAFTYAGNTADTAVEASPSIRVEGDILTGLERAKIEPSKRTLLEYGTNDTRLEGLAGKNRIEVKKAGNSQELKSFMDTYPGQWVDGFAQGPSNEKEADAWSGQKAYQHALFTYAGLGQFIENFRPVYSIWVSQTPLKETGYAKQGEMPGNPAITTYWADSESERETPAFKRIVRALLCGMIREI